VGEVRIQRGRAGKLLVKGRVEGVKLGVCRAGAGGGERGRLEGDVPA